MSSLFFTYSLRLWHKIVEVWIGDRGQQMFLRKTTGFPDPAMGGINLKMIKTGTRCIVRKICSLGVVFY